MGYQIAPWPKGELIPKSMHDALRLGWHADGEGGGPDAVICLETGERTATVEMSKTVGNINLRIEIPFKAKYKYAPVSKPEAYVWCDPPRPTSPENQVVAQSHKGREFARILGRSICVRVKGKMIERADVFVEAFGPPEALKWKGIKLFYWNFQREDGALGFSLLHPLAIGQKPKREITVQTAVHRTRNTETFMPWLLGRLGAAVNGQSAPKFLNASRFVVVPA